MLYYVVRERTAFTIREFLASLDPADPPLLEVVTYERIFADATVPLGHLIFTDHDRLSPWELEAAEAAARAVERKAPEARIYNRPASVRCRYPMLRRLRQAGLLPYDTVRLEEETLPPSFPVFIRREAEARGPETGLIEDPAAYRRALADMAAAGLPLAGRIAIGYHAEPDADGVFRKYGAVRFGDRIVPQHLYFSRDWVVKKTTVERSLAMLAEEAAFGEANPHADALMPLFQEARIEFGRADYTVTSAGVVLYEINTNPNLPRRAVRGDGRDARRARAVAEMVAGFRALDAGPVPRGRAWLRLPPSGQPAEPGTAVPGWLRRAAAAAAPRAR